MVAEASTPAEVLKQTTEHTNVLLLEIALGGTVLIESVAAKKTDTKILVLADEYEDEMAFQSLLAGARGYILKTAEPNELAKSIVSVDQGELWVPRSLIDVFLRRTNTLSRKSASNNGLIQSLSPRKREIVMLVSQGLSNKEIATELCISERTVKVHLYHIFKSFGVRKRNELIPLAIRLPH